MLQEPTVEELRQCVTLESHFKVVHDGDNGEYSSCFAGQQCDKNMFGLQTTIIPKPYNYRIGMITHDSPPTSNGIYTYALLEQAIHHADGSTPMIVEKPTAVLEVKLLKVERGRTDSIYVVKKVWPEEDTITFNDQFYDDYAKVEERLCGHTFKVGDYVRVKSGITCGVKGEIGRIKSPRPSEGYQVDFPSYRGWLADNGELVHAERPAPTEEWVDVTEECTVKLVRRPGDTNYQGYKLLVHHGVNCNILEVGSIVVSLSTYHGEYAVAFEEPYSITQGGFTILHKVITEYPV